MDRRKPFNDLSTGTDRKETDVSAAGPEIPEAIIINYA
jgi:hypothetical protein